jgi:hypothetical protein
MYMAVIFKFIDEGCHGEKIMLFGALKANYVMNSDLTSNIVLKFKVIVFI